MSCKFISELRRLSKLSAEAVQNLDSFDSLKKYLHVVRNTEADFKHLLVAISGITHKQLVLVCGSAGDGKSHLLSHMKHNDPEGLLADYVIINDATESNAPRETATQTLAGRIAAFRDDRLNDGGCEKVVLAINLGMLNNFIDSEEGKAFQALRNYVLNNKIFSVAEALPFDKNGIFQHIDFSDYQLYTLTEAGAKSDYLKELFSRIFAADSSNSFYVAYVNSASCPHHAHCPVRHNFELLMNQAVQEQLIQRIIEVCIKDKLIVTSRDVLNFIFDAIASPDFDDKNFWKTISNPVKFLESYIAYTTPMLMFENNGTSELIDRMTVHSAKSESVEVRDNAVLSFYAADDITETVKGVLGNSKYADMLLQYDLSTIDNARDDLKKYVYKFLMHYQKIADPATLSSDTVYTNFVKDLFHSYAGNRASLKELYKAVHRSIYAWDGTYGNDLICIDDSNDDYCILEKLSIESDVLPGTGEPEIFQFTPSITVRFKDEAETGRVRLSIDFSLYKLIMAMRDGYCPTSQDRNIHADFASGVKALAELGSQRTRVIIVSKRKSSTLRYMFKETDFGYSFKEV